MNQSNVINLISDEEGEDHSLTSGKKVSEVVNLLTDYDDHGDDLLTDDEDNGDEAVRGFNKDLKSMHSHTFSFRKEGNNQPAALFHSTCAVTECSNPTFSRGDVESICKRCEMTKRYDASRLAAKQKKSESEISFQHSHKTSQAKSSKQVIHSSLMNRGVKRPHHHVPVHQPSDNANFSTDSDSESLPELSQILSAKKAKSAPEVSKGSRPTKDLPSMSSTSSLRASSSRSTRHEVKRLIPKPSISLRNPS